MTASQNFTASNGESRNPLYEGCFDGETLVAAANRRHWALAAQELALACATHPQAPASTQPEAEAQKAVAWLTVCGPTAGCGVQYVGNLAQCPNCGKVNFGLPAGTTLTAAPTPQAVKVPLTEVGTVMVRVKDGFPRKAPELYERFTALLPGTVLYADLSADITHGIQPSEGERK